MEVPLIAIRLTRKGSKKKPVYRVVVAEKTSPRDGRFLEILGHYNPIPDPAEFQLDLERVNSLAQQRRETFRHRSASHREGSGLREVQLNFAILRGLFFIKITF